MKRKLTSAGEIDSFTEQTIRDVDLYLEGERQQEQAICRECGADLCPHGVCSENWCGEDEHCRECWRKQELEREAQREFEFQRDVVGPLLGLTDADAERAQWDAEVRECEECQAHFEELDREREQYWLEHWPVHGCEYQQ